ncbi:biopolymer transporter ExbD [Aeromonas hydrophila]|uniref:Biopolymer transporter ExbD n=1 Tax=Aeromonas hydrophila TaxID=644 RepID=A0A926FPM4_AERHY|nr:biopolymer transporter ExbD [Aeromonas hydrophila]
MAFGKLSDEGTINPSEINMIPMIDVMLVLLIVFMITAPCSPTPSSSSCQRPAASSTSQTSRTSTSPSMGPARSTGTISRSTKPPCSPRWRAPARPRGAA